MPTAGRIANGVIVEREAPGAFGPGGALVLEIAGAAVGGVVGGARALCVGWLLAMGLEILLAVPVLRQAFGGLH